MKKRLGLGLLLVALTVILLAVLRAPPGDHPAGQGPSPSGQAAEEGLGPGKPPQISGSVATIPRFNRLPPGRERHFQAIRTKDEARLRGGRVPRSSELFEAESRDPVWGPAMESKLGERLRKGAELFSSSGVKDVRMPSPECKTSTCRLSFEYTSETLEGRSPLGLLVRQTGPLSSSSSDQPPEPLRVVDGVTHFRQVVYVLFGDEESNPSDYLDWVAEFQRRSMEYKRRHGLPTAENR